MRQPREHRKGLAHCEGRGTNLDGEPCERLPFSLKTARGAHNKWDRATVGNEKRYGFGKSALRLAEGTE